jgi:hypothetical protein
MNSIHTTKSQDAEPEKRSSAAVLLLRNRWWLFCLAVLLLKLLLFALDPTPRLPAADSFHYFSSALAGNVPEDRSYFYAFVIRWLCNSTGSLTPLVLLQTLLGAVVAVAVAWICRSMLRLSEGMAYLFGFLCSIDPLQVTWEQSITPDTLSLFFYALVLLQSFVYLHRRRVANLVGVQVASILAIAFRCSFVVPMQIMAVALPLIAFGFEKRSTTSGVSAGGCSLQCYRRPAFWIHLILSVALTFVLHQGYRSLTGRVSRGPAAYDPDVGYWLLASWAPTLQPQDAPDPRLSEILRRGSEFGLPNETLRPAQRNAPNRLIDRWRRVETDKWKSRDIARQTAFNALKRTPLGVLRIAARTYYSFWRGLTMERLAQADVAPARLNDYQKKVMFEQYHWRGSGDGESGSMGFCGWYYVAAVPYYFAILLLPLLSIALIFVSREKKYALLLFAHTVLVFCATLLLSVAPTVRHWLPLSPGLLFCAALAVKALYPALSESAEEGSRKWADQT